ncbi:peptidoglycan/LPS O-acetylase OafA/YrhL [Mucilaginibacter yixingensis]|uniref:Peptidoglycan/LPS O-acetylase OafA/YrhL n=1 Tax=Mucilaginibacter yixingensis TaxID=1295612 RepID=A0A2T5JGQ4_9SPHI|nr:acyltransferase [Mucilaginibacter yixingensis]PTR01574.1 peptidoglycan/LPS O-acetylase OafA/YrhL [Mucilaginibacter yixingensis]
MEKVHYPNLNFLRGLTALIVVIHHTEQLKSTKGYPNIWHHEAVQLIGKLGVDVFFVLSGFLITSLLFIEQKLVKKIPVKKFLMRRVLRIWPVYFLVFLIAFFITPFIHQLQVGPPFVSSRPQLILNIILYLLFLPHIQAYLIGPVVYCAQSWSIGVEEYFYLCWPFVVNKFKTRGIVYFIVSFMLIYLAICGGAVYLLDHGYCTRPLYQKIAVFIIYGLKFDCLLIGALFAIINNNIKNQQSVFISWWFQLLLYFTEIILIYTAVELKGFYWELHAIIYGFIILNMVRKETSIVNFEYPIFNFLGKISYGIYMYHVLIANLCIIAVYKFKVPVLLYPLTFGVTILVSVLSYKYFEGFFLKKKLSYAIIKTG